MKFAKLFNVFVVRSKVNYVLVLNVCTVCAASGPLYILSNGLHSAYCEGAMLHAVDRLCLLEPNTFLFGGGGWSWERMSRSGDRTPLVPAFSCLSGYSSLSPCLLQPAFRVALPLLCSVASDVLWVGSTAANTQSRREVIECPGKKAKGVPVSQTNSFFSFFYLPFYHTYLDHSCSSHPTIGLKEKLCKKLCILV